MTSEIVVATPVPVPSTEVSPELAADWGRGVDYARSAMSAATRRAYASAWRVFDAWCAARGVGSLPASPDALVAYVGHLAGEGAAVATVNKHMAAIAAAHKAADHDANPTRAARVLTVLAGLRRDRGVAQRSKDALTRDLLRQCLVHVPDTLKGRRDRAMLLVLYSGALRRSEFVGIDVEHVTFKGPDAIVLLPKSKTDQEGAGRVVPIAGSSKPDTCPVASMRAWLEASGIESGPMFRRVTRHGAVGPARLSAHAVALTVKAYAGAAGLDPDRFGAHSMRAGHITTAVEEGFTAEEIMGVSGHRSLDTLRRYIRRVDPFTGTSARGVGL